MRKLFFTLCLLLPNFAFSFDTQVKGFIALDAFNYKKIQRQKDAIDMGIGVLDLKVFAEQDSMLAAIKLNVDGNLSVQNNLFEEAYATYRGFKNIRITLGKGVVKFQNLHYGVIENTYQDGGTVLETENSWRKISNKALLAFAYGNKYVGFTDTFTIWGDSQEVQFDEKGNAKYTSSGSGTAGQTATNPKYITAYNTKSVPAFTTQKQLGLANKFELYKGESWTFTTGQAYYKAKLQDRASYAVDFGATLDTNTWEYWLDMIYGFTSKQPFDAYNTYRKTEYFVQTGAQYHFDETWSVLTNWEFLHVKDRAFTYTAFNQDGVWYNADSSINRSGQEVVSTSFKIEAGVQTQISKSSFITNGLLYEKKIAKQNGVEDLAFIKGVYNANAEAWQFLSTVSFWF